MKTLKTLIYFLIVFSSLTISAQRGGESLFGILHLTQSARMASLGGNQAGIDGHDLAMLLHNPALLDSSFSKSVSTSYVPYIAGINYGYGGIAWNFKKIGTFALGFQNMGYGNITAADETGTITGSFTAGESVIQMSYSRQLNKRFTGGISIKPVFSTIESYSSWGMAFDAGFFYRHPDALLTSGLVLRNFGRQISSYSDIPTESLRPDLQIGISKKLAHAPFRLSLTAQDLLTGGISYKLPESESNGNSSETDDSWGSKMLRHFIIGVEFVPSKNFYVAGGYNARRRSELKVDSKTSTVGLTWGFGVKIYKFNFAYGSGRYHLGGSSNHFSITTNLSSF